jgi:hypothetical protein
LVAIDRERAAGGHLVGVGGAHDQRAQPAHLRVQQPDRVVGGVVRSERVRADQLGHPLGPMGFGHPERAHLMQNDGHTGPRHLPGGFGAGETRADDMHRF